MAARRFCRTWLPRCVNASSSSSSSMLHKVRESNGWRALAHDAGKIPLRVQPGIVRPKVESSRPRGVK